MGVIVPLATAAMIVSATDEICFVSSKKRGQCGLCNYERGLMTENSLCVCVFIYFIFMSHISLRVYEILVISVSILFFFIFFYRINFRYVVMSVL